MKKIVKWIIILVILAVFFPTVFLFIKDKVNSGLDTIESVAPDISEAIDDYKGDDSGSKLSYENTKNNHTASFNVINIGQGSSLLIESGGEYALIDGGDNSASDTLIAVLKKYDISSFKYMIATHYDSDHIAGLVGALKNYKVETFLSPNYTPESTRTYSSLMNELGNKNNIHPSPDSKYQLGNLTIEFLGPTKDYGEDNANSLTMMIYDSSGNYLYVGGDSTAEPESMIVETDKSLLSECDVMIVDHHGSKSSSAKDFLTEASPTYAIISCGKGNDYGHPTSAVLNRLDDLGVKLYRTDIQGDIKFCFSESGIAFEQNPTDDFSSGNS